MLRARINLLLIGIISFIFISNNLYSQDKANSKAWFVEAESYFLFEEYKDALPLYQRIIRTEHDNYNVQYKIGICYLNDIYKNSKSIKYLEEATRHISPNYKFNSYKEKLAPIEALYYLGSAYHINNQFNEAIEYYQKFLQVADADEFDFDMVQADIEACQRAKISYSKQVYFRPKNVGDDINTRFEDVNPVISGDGKVLAFTRKLQFYDGVFITYRGKDGEWSPPRNLTADFGLDGNSYTTGITYFGDELYIYRSDNYDGNIYLSRRVGNKWTALERLNDNINSKYWESHASPSPDGQFLYFTSNREGGYGGLDIYKARRSTNGEWGQAVNLGPVINTPNNEETPFVSNEGYTLFFSSQGHNTIGGYDIYISNLKSDGTWEKPNNMGYPINTTNNDVFYCPTGIDAFAYYSYYNPETTKGLVDIYKVEVYNDKIPRLFAISGKIDSRIIDQESLAKFSVQLLAIQTQKQVAQSKVNKDGEYALKAKQGDYILQIDGPDMEPHQQTISLKIGQDKSDIVLPLISLGVGHPQKQVELPMAKEVIESEIKVDNNYIVTTDSMPIPIELTLKKGSTLEIATFIGDSLYTTKVIADIKKRFVYFHKPLPGENKLVFKATDTEGNVSGTEVIIQYHPKEPELKTDEPMITEQRSIGLDKEYLLQLASPDLALYLQDIDISSYQNSGELFSYLLGNIPEGEQALRADVQDLISKFYTQKSLDNFRESLLNYASISDTQLDTYTDSVLIPMELVNAMETDAVLSKKELQTILLQIAGDDYTSLADLREIIASYMPESSSRTFDELEFETRDKMLEYIINSRSDDVNGSLKFAATTEALQFYYQNLLLSSSGGLHDFLASINFEAQGIYTAPQLIAHLFSNVSESTYTQQELLDALEKARASKAEHLKLFHEMLTVSAEGTLKSQLMLMEGEQITFDSYENYLNYILNQSEFKNYSRENVYNMLLDLIGINDIDDFSEKLISYGYGNINNAIADTSLKYFSNPFELVQYLVSASQTYDFTTSDINNLLIRMILEQGMDRVRDIVYYDDVPKKFWKKKEFITSIILVNIVLIILVVLFSLRRRKG